MISDQWYSSIPHLGTTSTSGMIDKTTPRPI